MRKCHFTKRAFFKDDLTLTYEHCEHCDTNQDVELYRFDSILIAWGENALHQFYDYKPRENRPDPAFPVPLRVVHSISTQYSQQRAGQ